MALNNFTLTHNPFTGLALGDGTSAGTTQIYFIDADRGDDNNPGTRDLPFKSLSKMVSLSSSDTRIFVLRGIFDEGVVIGGIGNLSIIGDLNTEIRGNVQHNTGQFGTFVNVANINMNVFGVLNAMYSTVMTHRFRNCNINVFNIVGNSANNYPLQEMVTESCYIGSMDVINRSFSIGVTHTTCKVLNVFSYSSPVMYDSIVSDVVNFKTGTTSIGVQLYNCIVRKQVEWRWNNITIPITWTTVGNEINDIKNSVIDFADTSTVPSGNKDTLKAQIQTSNTYKRESIC